LISARALVTRVERPFCGRLALLTYRFVRGSLLHGSQVAPPASLLVLHRLHGRPQIASLVVASRSGGRHRAYCFIASCLGSLRVVSARAKTPWPLHDAGSLVRSGSGLRRRFFKPLIASLRIGCCRPGERASALTADASSLPLPRSRGAVCHRASFMRRIHCRRCAQGSFQAAAS